jgi:hypothetical protein
VSRFVYQFRDVAGAVEKTVVGMKVKMDKTRCRHRQFILVAPPQIFQNAADVFNRLSAALCESFKFYRSVKIDQRFAPAKLRSPYAFGLFLGVDSAKTTKTT